MPLANTRVRTVIVTPTDPAANAPSLLLVQVEIDCPHCGHVEFAFWGHHLTSLVAALEGIRVGNPGLVGEPSTVVERSGWSGTPPADPSMN